MLWALSGGKFLVIAVLLVWWLFWRPKTVADRLVFTLAAALAAWSLGLPLPLLVLLVARTVVVCRLDVLVLQHAKMMLTFGAAAWLLHRAWQTLRRPVPDLINILGVEVPDAPDVSLAGISPHAATLNWTRPLPNRPVQKFIIQVNGVDVGESAQHETAITVTGLKPNRFYNLRVIAVGPNSFQAGSEVIRLRTWKRDGKPALGNSRVPDGFMVSEQKQQHGDHVDDQSPPKSPVPSIETARPVDTGMLAPREASQTVAGTRRNTVNRRHSPSVHSTEAPPIPSSTANGPEPSLQELNEKFERIRRETDDTLGHYAREDADFKQTEEQLRHDKDSKKQQLKEKDDRSDQLRKAANAAQNQMRNTEREKVKKEKLLHDKEAKRANVHETIKKWDIEIDRMRKKRDCFEADKSGLEEGHESKLDGLDEETSFLKDECSALERELKDKKDQLKQLEAARKRLPGGEEDAQWREADAEMRKNWALKKRDMETQVIGETRKGHQLDSQLQLLYAQLNAAAPAAAASLYSQANSSGVDFEQPTQTQLKRRSRNSSSLQGAMPSPPGGFAAIEPNSFTASTSLVGRMGFAPGPYMEMALNHQDQSMNEAELAHLRAGAPLSPTATALLPSGILMDDDPPSPSSKPSQRVLSMALEAPPEPDPQSPASSSRSHSIFSSPHSSSLNLGFTQYQPVDNSDRLSLSAARGDFGIGSSPSVPSAQASGHRLGNIGNIWSSLHRSRNAKATDEPGIPIGSLKQGQSQSFPRQTDDPDLGNRRRISFSSSSWFNRNSTGPELDGGAPLGSRVFSARRLIPFGGSNAAAQALYAERDPSSPRPASIASSDMPRPSTDSNSIWNHPGEGTTLGKSRLWPTHDSLWSSRNPSRRPSLHGSPSALKTTLASADDEILDEDDLLDPQVSPSQVGVIGSRPQKSLSQRLNPAAPTFMTGLFRPKSEKDKDKEHTEKKDKAKTKDKDKSKDKKAKAKDKDKEATTPSIETPSLSMDDSPSDSRKSRDAFSVHTQTSVSESRESLTLDRTFSNTPSEPTTSVSVSNAAASSLAANNLKGEENVVRKLFRKGSSSKSLFSARLGKDSGLFKKGPAVGGGAAGGSTSTIANSDKNFGGGDRSSIGDVEDADETGSGAALGRSYDSVTSSPSLGPARSKDLTPKDGRMNWTGRFAKKNKKGKGEGGNKDSLELESEELGDEEKRILSDRSAV